MIHENKKPILKKTLICEVCGKGFSAPSKLAHHAISHLDREQSKMVITKRCPSSIFSSRSDKFTDEIDILFFFVFNRQTERNSSIAIHQKQCDVCGKWLKNQIMLRKHKLTHIHTPVECQHCHKIKFNKDALRSHIAQCHTAPKHQCTICHKSYLRRKLLEVISIRKCIRFGYAQYFHFFSCSRRISQPTQLVNTHKYRKFLYILF